MEPQKKTNLPENNQSSRGFKFHIDSNQTPGPGADSPEAKEQYFLQKIEDCQNRLNQFTLQENPVEITIICLEIRETRRRLEQFREWRRQNEK